MKQLMLIIIGLNVLTSCQSSNNQTSLKKEAPENIALRDFSARFVEAYALQFPEVATAWGYHKYDSLLTIYDEQQKEQTLAFATAWKDSLNNYSIDALSNVNQIDYHLITNQLDQISWQINELKQHEWDPSRYNVSDVFASMLHEKYAPIARRLHLIHQRLKHVPEYYRQAKANIQNPVKELVQLAIDQNLGGIPIFSKDLKDSIDKAHVDVTTKNAYYVAVDSAIIAINDYAAWLKTFPPAQMRSFRLGEKLYEQKFKFDIQSEFTAAEMYDMANARKQYLHIEMARLSHHLWTKYFPNQPRPNDSLELIGRLIDTLSRRHTCPDSFQIAIEQHIPKLEAFVAEKDLLYIDRTKPLVVRKEPAYMAGVAGVSISAPGAFDKNGNTYYNVGSIEGWLAAKAESYLREYNDYILQILNIHEAVPGHYTQLVYANESPSIIKSLFGNGAMIEGWAVYAEQMMLENGYGNDEPEMWLMWYKWHLRTVCNTILDYKVHVQNMSQEDAINLLTKEAFQQQAEAEGKWNRVTLTSVQLTSYFSGYQEIHNLRETYKKQRGQDFRLKEFHERFLSYGSAPVKYIRQMMIE
jgi:uncharacterized protein (DUF885 family)